MNVDLEKKRDILQFGIIVRGNGVSSGNVISERRHLEVAFGVMWWNQESVSRLHTPRPAAAS